jgi:hypothetical protein
MLFFRGAALLCNEFFLSEFLSIKLIYFHLTVVDFSTRERTCQAVRAFSAQNVDSRTLLATRCV